MTSKTLGELPLPEPGEGAYRRGRERLRRAFDGARVECAFVDGPFGRVFLAGGSRGLCRIALRSDAEAFLDQLERDRLLPRLDPGSLGEARRELEEYFAGRRRQFGMGLDLRSVTDFQRRVLGAASEIPFGGLASYGDLAHRIRQPGASRAVGHALGRNPLPIVVPCHRVVAAGGRLGGYTGGLHIKCALLRIEGSPM